MLGSTDPRYRHFAAQNRPSILKIKGVVLLDDWQ
jgi:hypothetical protein